MTLKDGKPLAQQISESLTGKSELEVRIFQLEERIKLQDLQIAKNAEELLPKQGSIDYFTKVHSEQRERADRAEEALARERTAAKTRRRPKTGESRKTRQPFNLDLLPRGVRDSIEYLRKQGKRWMEIARLSGLPFSPDWQRDGGGFIDWDGIPSEVTRLFPNRRIPHSNLHRWYDVRIEQKGRS